MREQGKRQAGPPAKSPPLARFPKAAHLEATAICARQADWLEGRREVAGITIDGPASKDLDDAFWLERDPSTGGYLLFVSIADVAAAVTPVLTPALDTAARARAFTRYGARSLTPMLPRLLSEERLSLLAGAVRPTITVRLPLDSALRVGELVIELTALRSRKRWTYEEVDAEIADPQTEFGAMLRLAWHLAEQLLKRRRAAGALALYDLASGWATTEEGALVQLPPSRRHKAHIIVQELMVLVNQQLAEYLAERGILALYRNHTARATAPERETLREMIETAMTHPERGAPQRVQKTMMLTLERARYAPIVAGHFGLNLPAYLHATSPLRRYPDLVNQRILHAVLAGDPPPYTSEELAALAAQINTEEDRLRDARQRLFLAAYDEPLRALLAHASRSAAGQQAGQQAGQGEDAAEDDAQEAQRREVAEEQEEQEEQEDEADQEPLTPLATLDEKRFHSVLRLVAQGQASALQPAVEREILRRLAEGRLGPHDLFTLLYRFPTGGPAWSRVKRAALTWLAEHAHHASSLLVMGQQSLDWRMQWQVSEEGPAHHRQFQARLAVQAGAQSYRSALQRAAQKDLAKSRAAVDVLANMAGMHMPEIAAALAQDLAAGRKAREAGEPAEQAERAGRTGEIAEPIQDSLVSCNEEGAPDQAEPGEGDARAAAGTGAAQLAPVVQEVAEKEWRGKEETGQEISASPGEPQAHNAPAAPSPDPPERQAPRQNFKGLLQEQCAGARWERPVYREVSRSGPPHAPTFTVRATVTADGVVYEEIGVGKTKGQAEQEAARRLLEQIPSPQAQAPKSLSETRLQNAIGVLNEMAQRREIQSVEYAYAASGPPHALVFTCTCQVTRCDGTATSYQAKGQTKKEAAQAAAKLAALSLLLAKER